MLHLSLPEYEFWCILYECDEQKLILAFLYVEIINEGLALGM